MSRNKRCARCACYIGFDERYFSVTVKFKTMSTELGSQNTVLCESCLEKAIRKCLTMPIVGRYIRKMPFFDWVREQIKGYERVPGIKDCNITLDSIAKRHNLPHKPQVNWYRWGKVKGYNYE